MNFNSFSDRRGTDEDIDVDEVGLGTHNKKLYIVPMPAPSGIQTCTLGCRPVAVRKMP